jgi:formylmethanofuran dehydrogenase subunit E
MPDEEMFTIADVQLKMSVEAIVSRPGVRVNCDGCGEEIMNERESHHEGLTLCRACAGQAYYRLAYAVPQDLSHQISDINIAVQTKETAFV